MNNRRPIVSEAEAISLAKDYYQAKHFSLSNMPLAAMPFERGWLVGPSNEDSRMLGQLDVTLLIVDRDGSIAERTANRPPRQLIEDYVSGRAAADSTSADLNSCFIASTQLVRQASLLHDEAIATNATPNLTVHIADHATALTRLRDQLHDLRLTKDDLDAGAVAREDRRL